MRLQRAAPAGRSGGHSPKPGGQDVTDGNTLSLFEREAGRSWLYPAWVDDLELTAGMKDAASGVPRWWWEAGLASIEEHAATGQPFGVDRVRGDIGEAPARTQCAFGALFATASRLGWIVPVGWTVTKDGNRVRLWIGGDA